MNGFRGTSKESLSNLTGFKTSGINHFTEMSQIQKAKALQLAHFGLICAGFSPDCDEVEFEFILEYLG